jgi:hypothetical protein
MLMPRIGSRIGRVEPQRRARALVDAAPGGMQHLLSRRPGMPAPSGMTGGPMPGISEARKRHW